MESKENRMLQTSRAFNVPLSLMWEIWTNPKHIAHWWGPNGFHNTIHQMDFEIGGLWKFTMHGPDGTNFPNRSIFTEIVPFQKIAFEHFNPHFHATVLFYFKEGSTHVDWTMLFDTAEMFNTIVSVHRADQGQQENLDKLDAYISKVKC